MMGRLTTGQAQLFYAFHLDEVVPADHMVRRLDAVLDLGWIHKELAPFYSHTGRPSIAPELMLRMLLVGYVFAIRSARRKFLLRHVAAQHRIGGLRGMAPERCANRDCVMALRWLRA